MRVADMTPAELSTWFDASETDELARRDDGTDDAIVIRSSIRLGGTGDCAINFGPMTRERCRVVESYVAWARNLRGRRNLRAEWAARKAAGR